MKSKKFMALGSSLLLVVALFTAGFSTAAAADPAPTTPTGSLTGVATCDTTDGSATVTWTLTNNANQRMWVTWSANGYVPNTASLDANASETFTTAVASPAAGKTLTETVKLRWADDSAQGKTPASVTVGNGCLPPPVAVGTLTADATCNADGSGTVTWTLTNEYNSTMSVTWTANSNISSQNNTVAPRGSKTFTKTIAAPSGGKSASATIKLSWRDGSSQGKTSAGATVPSDCAPAPVAAGTLVADATCNADGSGTITWTLTNEYSGVMSVTWSANAYISNQTTVAAHASKTFTKTIAAPAAGKSLSETVKLSWRDGSSQGKTTAGATVGTDCVTPPPPPVCAASDFTSANMWEVTWGYDFEHRNGGAPIFTMQSNGGLTQLNGGPVPSYMSSSWHWLYITMGSPDRVVTYTFADGTVRTATVTGADCTPTIVWATIPPPPAICVGADVDWRHGTDDVSWEIHLGRQITDRNSPATFNPANYGGIVSIVGFDESLGNGDNIYVHYPEDLGATNTYTFADGSTLVATVVSGADCAPTIDWAFTPPPPVCAASDFTSANMWEVTWGYDFEHRNGGAPIFTMQSNGGLTQLNGGPVPSYMSSSWHWLYITMGSPDRVVTYTFADGTVRTATVTGADCTPTIVWATIPPPAPSVTFTHSEVCGQVTLGVESNATVGATWYFGLKATVDGTLLGSVLQQGPGVKTTTLSLAEDSHGGSAVITVFVHAATEWDIISPAELNYQSTYPDTGDHVWLITVDTDCLPPVPITTTVSASFLDHTCSVLGSMTLTGEHVTWTIVSDNPTAAGPGGTVITGVPSGTWPALLNGALPQSATNTPYYGGTHVTAVADPGYSLDSYSEFFVAHEPTACGATSPPAATFGAGGTGGGGGSATGGTPDTILLDTLAVTDAPAESSSTGNSSGGAASGTTSGADDLETRVVTQTTDDGVWLWYVSGFLLFGIFFIVIVWWRRRRNA